MSDSAAPAHGSIGWLDLTVDDHEAARDFYAAVVGWTPSPVDMGEYEDFSMTDASGRAHAGICAKRGSNADQAPGWIPYFIVADLDEALAQCAERGGRVLRPPKGEGARFAVIADPTGAACALYQPA